MGCLFMVNPIVALGLPRREIESDNLLSFVVRQIVSLTSYPLAYKMALARIDTLKLLPSSGLI